MKIIYTFTFNEKIIEIKNYLKVNHPTYLKSTILEINQKAESLDKNPYIGRLGKVEGTRELIFTKLPYFIIYEIDDNKQEILILNILHTAMKYP
ncbi:MAG: type II toxin-antitoxin system RelE/ParE family toxin [Alphaproteobacteria bacterium]|jgi:addiction module RelE/StbE family toxin|nr:type II toxin-antitoxin system RelE/ParE family toxin [Alphaproteobacteria bacterium]